MIMRIATVLLLAAVHQSHAKPPDGWADGDEVPLCADAWEWKIVNVPIVGLIATGKETQEFMCARSFGCAGGAIAGCRHTDIDSGIWGCGSTTGIEPSHDRAACGDAQSNCWCPDSTEPLCDTDKLNIFCIGYGDKERLTAVPEFLNKDVTKVMVNGNLITEVLADASQA